MKETRHGGSTWERISVPIVGPTISTDEYIRRIVSFQAYMPKNSIAIFPARQESIRSRDLPYPYRQHSNLIYMNGFPEQDAVLVLSKLGSRFEVIMFVQAKDPEKEQWTGFRLGREGARKKHLADKAYHIDELPAVLGKLMARADSVYYRMDVNQAVDATFKSVWLAEQKPLLNPNVITNELRLIKSDEEIAMLRHSARIASEGHIKAMEMCRPGVLEYQLQAAVEATFTMHGAMSPAYPSIVGGGLNGCILHYIENMAAVKDGDLVLIDAGAEYQGYASDITRTFPANGKFSGPQRDIYELVLKAQKAVIAAARPGVTMFQLHRLSEKILRSGLIDLGILSPEMHSAKAEKDALARYQHEHGDSKGKAKPPITLPTLFPHRIGHWIGIDTHDVGGPGLNGESGKAPVNSNRYARFIYGYTRPFEPNMCITDEPGIYIMPDERIDKKWWNIGVRIEDDLRITEDGCEVLSAGAPKEIADIERLMAKSRAA